jgi:hypothetical protein
MHRNIYYCDVCKREILEDKHYFFVAETVRTGETHMNNPKEICSKECLKTYALTHKGE